jgi:hypothetical protein
MSDSENRQRNNLVAVRFNDAEYAALQAAAERAGKGESTLLRETFLASPENRAPVTDDVGVPPEIVHDLMGLAAKDRPPLEVVRTWSAEQLAAAAEWATLEHLAASDNDVRRVERPGFTRPAPAS